MDKTITYSVLRYIPSTVAGEKINLGMIIIDETNDYREFYYTKKISRIKKFDDEISKEKVLKLLLSIKKDVEKSIFNYESFDIDEYTKYYKNSYYFDYPQKLIYENFEMQVEDLKKTYFRFDFEKDERPSIDDDMAMLDRMIQSEYDGIKKNSVILGTAKESIQFDYIIGNRKIKILDFDNKDLKRMVNTVKAWAWNCSHDDSIIIIYRKPSDAVDSNEYKVLKSIIQTNMDNAYSIEEGIDFIKSR